MSNYGRSYVKISYKMLHIQYQESCVFYRFIQMSSFKVFSEVHIYTSQYFFMFKYVRKYVWVSVPCA
jgi:hypothetical protein